MHCVDTGMNATGITPTYVFMDNQIILNQNVIKALEKSETQVPVSAKTPIDEMVSYGSLGGYSGIISPVRVFAGTGT